MRSVEYKTFGGQEVKRVSGDNEHGAAALYSQQQAYVTLRYLLTMERHIDNRFITF